jgi:hypothetical protein
VVSALGDFFTSGLRDLEREWRQGDDVGVADVSWAGLDLLVMAGSFKLLRAGKAAGMSRTGRAVGQGRAAATARFASLGNAAKVTAIVGVGYMALRHPSLISAAGTSLARWLGWPEWTGQFLVWFLILLPALYLFRILVIWVVVPCYRMASSASRACAKVLAGKAAPDPAPAARIEPSAFSPSAVLEKTARSPSFTPD